MEQLWVEQYRPKSLSSLDFNNELSVHLTELSKSEDFPHLLFYGPNGAGKKTRVMAFLREVFGTGVYQVKQEERDFKVSETTSTTIQCSILSSKYHLDVTPSDCENQDRIIIQKLIKEAASSSQVNTNTQHDFKVIIINEVDNLTHDAQASLRRTMEKYIEKCRLILVCEQLSKVIDPIRSRLYYKQILLNLIIYTHTVTRCLLLRCPAPNKQEITNSLNKISQLQNINLPQKLAERLANQCEGNLREAILSFQAAKIERSQLTDDQKIQTQEWKEFINKNIAEKIIKNQNPETLKEIRDRYYELLVNCIPPDRIIRCLLDSLIANTNQKIHHDLIYHAADCDNKLKMGQNAIFHLEAFAARCMVVIMKQ